MRLRLMTLTLAVALLGLFTLTPFVESAAAAPITSGITQTITAPATANGVLGTLTGTLNITQFAVQNGQLVAIGTLSGTITNALGQVIGTIPAGTPVTIPVNTAASTGSCQILDLVLGPLDLNLLGLVVHLDTVHLNITAQSGSGNLLGNLLCAVAHLLDNGGPLQGLAGLLNNILRQL